MGEEGGEEKLYQRYKKKGKGEKRDVSRRGKGRKGKMFCLHVATAASVEVVLEKTEKEREKRKHERMKGKKS